jgi:hypothetical protein
METSGKNRRGQAGGTGTEDGYVAGSGRLRKQAERLSGIAPVYAAGAASCLFTVEIVLHAPQRTLTRLGSSVMPMICVRWLPHFGQT